MVATLLYIFKRDTYVVSHKAQINGTLEILSASQLSREGLRNAEIEKMGSDM